MRWLPYPCAGGSYARLREDHGEPAGRSHRPRRRAAPGGYCRVRHFLLASGAHTAVQAHLLVLACPCALPVLLGRQREASAARKSVAGQQRSCCLAVFGQHQQLVESLLEVLPAGPGTTLALILGCRITPCQPEPDPIPRRPPAWPPVARPSPLHPCLPDLSELPRVALELAEAGLVAHPGSPSGAG